MKKNYLYKVTNIVLLLVFFVALQMFQYHYIFKDALLPTYWYLDFLLVTFLGSLVLLFRSRLFDMIYIPILYGFTVVCSLVNINFYNTVGDIFSLTYLAMIENSLNVAASAASVDVPFTVLGSLSIVLLLALILLSNRFLFPEDPMKIKEEYEKKKKVNIASSILTLSLLFASYAISYATTVPSYISSTIMIEKKENYKDYGMLNYFIKEGNYIANGDKINDTIVNNLQKYFTTPQEVENSFSGLLKDYNVVNICVETGDDLMLNETLAPNLYSLFEDAISFESNYSKNKTNISEFIGLTGSAPVAGISKKYDYNLPFSVPTILHNDGYYTMYFHDAPQDKDVYDRRELMPQLKFDRSYFREDLFPGAPGWDFSGNFSLDSLAMPVVADRILEHKDERFYAFYMTLSMHGPYDQPKNHDKLVSLYGEKYNSAVREGKFVNPLAGTVNEHCVDNYMMAVMDFDKGLGEFIQKFKDSGTYDNTLFVIYGDHEMYYVGADGVALNKSLEGTDDTSYAKMYKTIMYMVNPTLKKAFGDQPYTRFTSPYNVAPTVLDLLGYAYNPNYYLGHSIFSSEMEKTQVFYTLEFSGFFNADFWAFSHKAVTRTFHEGKDPDEFLQAVGRTVQREVNLNILYTNDFFTHHDFKDFTYPSVS